MLQSRDAAGPTQCCAASQQSHGTAQAGEARVVARMNLGKNLYGKMSGGWFKFECTYMYGSCCSVSFLHKSLKSKFNLLYFFKWKPDLGLYIPFLGLYKNGPFLMQLLNETGLLYRTSLIYTQFSQWLPLSFFCAVHSSKVESNLIALLLG